MKPKASADGHRACESNAGDDLGREHFGRLHRRGRAGTRDGVQGSAGRTNGGDGGNLDGETIPRLSLGAGRRRDVAQTSQKLAFPFVARIRQTAFDDGLICYPVGGNVDGVNGDIVIIAPPYNATDDELAEITDKFGHAVRKTLKTIERK